MTDLMTDNRTQRLQRVLLFIADYQHLTRGRSPSMRTICQGTGISFQKVRSDLDTAKYLGLLTATDPGGTGPQRYLLT